MKLVKMFSIIIVLLVITNITLSNHSLDDSKKMADLNKEVNSLTHELTITKSNLAEAGSLTKLASHIEEAGFTESPKIVSITAGKSVASR